MDPLKHFYFSVYFSHRSILTFCLENRHVFKFIWLALKVGQYAAIQSSGTSRFQPGAYWDFLPSLHMSSLYPVLFHFFFALCDTRTTPSVIQTPPKKYYNGFFFFCLGQQFILCVCRHLTCKGSSILIMQHAANVKANFKIKANKIRR